MVTCMKAIGRMTNDMAKAPIKILTVLCIYRGMGSRYTTWEVSRDVARWSKIRRRVSSRQIDKDLGCLHGLIARDMLENSIRSLYMVKAYINTVMVANMMANGRIINVMEKEFLHGEMDVNILENI